MSRIKSPQEKKRISLERDRRNVFGECPTASRKNISRGKRHSRKVLRKAANQELRSLQGVNDDVVAEEIEGSARDRILIHTRSAFRKLPDAPLGEVLEQKRKRRAKYKNRKKANRFADRRPH